MVAIETLLICFFRILFDFICNLFGIPCIKQLYKTREAIRDLEKIVSLKSVLVVMWVCLIAGAAVASESHRLCVENNTIETQQLHERLQLHEDDIEIRVLVLAEFDVTS